MALQLALARGLLLQASVRKRARIAPDTWQVSRRERADLDAPPAAPGAPSATLRFQAQVALKPGDR